MIPGTSDEFLGILLHVSYNKNFKKRIFNGSSKRESKTI